MRSYITISMAAIVGLITIAVSPSHSQAQLVREHDAKSLRGFHGSSGTRIKRSFQSDAEARNVLRYILTAAGLAGLEDRIILRASADTPNAEAFIDKNKDNQDERLIFYNAVFMQELQKQTKDYWSLVAVLAHELGHHVRFHTAIPGRDHEFELEADYQAGFILRRLGATIDQAQGAFRSIGGEQATASHPSRAERLQAVTIGWTDGDARHTPPWQMRPGQQPPDPPDAVFKGPAQTAASARLSEAAEAWDRTKDATNVRVFEVFLSRYAGTYYAELARARIEELKKQQQAVVAAPPASKPAPPTTIKSAPPSAFEEPHTKAVQPTTASPTIPRSPAGCVEIAVGQKGRRCLLPGAGKTEWFKDCEECPEMVVIPPGTFVRGSPDAEEGHEAGESPQHTVSIAKPFAVGRFEVTFAEWDACASAAKCIRANDAGWGRGRLPVIRISWEEAKAYTAWLSNRTGKKYRLLSEAEWEYVARAGKDGPFWFGQSITPEQANYNSAGEWGSYGGSPKATPRNKPIPVTSFDPNPFGLFNVHGNVFEWIEDCWHADYNGAPMDGSPWLFHTCTVRGIRGGAWSVAPAWLRSANRVWYPPKDRARDVGLRVARTLD